MRPTSRIPRRARMLGPLFESLVTQGVQVYAYRDEDGIAVIPAALLGP